MDRRSCAMDRDAAHGATLSAMTTIETPTDQRAVLPATLRLGPTHLTVSDLGGSIAFYERSLGLQVHRRDDDTAALGTGGEDLLVLTGQTGAPLGGRHAGLYHFALLFDSREELARADRAARRERARASRARPTTACPRRSTSATPTTTASSSTSTARARTGRRRRQPGERVGIYTVALDIQALVRTVAGRAVARARRPRSAHRPPAPARRRHQARARLLPRRARLRGHGEPRQRGVRVRGRLPPPPRLQRLARPRRQAQAGRGRRACATGPCSSTRADEVDEVRARVRGRRGRDRGAPPAASSCATRGRPPSRSPSRPPTPRRAPQ